MIALLIGFGSIAQKHRKALLSIYPGIVIYALRSKKDAPAIPGVINVYEWDALPANIDFAVICTPTFLHLQPLEILLEKKIPIMLEKPIANSLEGLDGISQKIIAENAFVYIACNLRFLPVLQFFKTYIETNRPVINEINVYAGSYLPAWRPAIDYKKNYSANAEMGGGVHLDLFHELDYTSWIFGLPQQSHVIKRNVSSLKISAVDYAVYVWEYEKYTATIMLNYYRPVAKRNMEIVFENETWNVNILTGEITNSRNEIIFSCIDVSIEDTYAAQMRYFAGCLANNQKPVFNTFEESLEILKLCLA